MAALAPGNIIYEIVDRHLEVAAARDCVAGKIAGAVVVQPAEKNNSLWGVVAGVTITLPREAPAEVVYECRPQYRRVTQREAPAQVQLRMFWARPYKVRHVIVSVVF